MADTCVLPGWNPNQTRQEVWTLLLQEEEDETAYKLPTFTLLALMMLVGLPGNVLVLLVYGFRFPASTTKNFIMAMAVFDLINCALGVPFEMVDLRYDIELDIAVVCKIIRFWISLSACGSVTVLVAVSVDRFRRICQPFRKQMTVRQSKVVIATLTVLSVGFSVPALILYGRHTEVRYGIELHDCSIDDVYKSGTFAAIYQYTLGVTWIASIVVLITMYSFVIYKIQLQKKRRHKLSSQSHDSTAVLATQRVHTNDISRKYNGVTRSSNEHSSFITCTHITAMLADNRNSSGGGDDDSTKIKGSRFVNRLFSRDVNPILEDEEQDEKHQCVYDSCDEDMPLPDFEFSAKLIKYKKTSLNNYLAGSRDTQLTNRSDSVPQTDAAESSRFGQSQDVSMHRTRKYGYSFGRYRPWESDTLIPNVGIISSAWDRGWISHSDHTLSRSRVHSHDYRCHFGRSSSLCSLKCVLHQQRSAPANEASGCYGNEQGPNLKHANDDKPRLPELDDDKPRLPELDDDGDATQHASPDSSLLTSHGNRVAPDRNSAYATPSASHAHQLNISEDPYSQPGAHLATDPVKRHKPGQTDTSLTLLKKKKTLSREIKTSRVSIMMLMVTLGFVLSYLPHLCIQVYKSISPSSVARLVCSSRVYFVVIHLLVRSFFINNAINPIIYSFYNKTFRDRCLRLLRSPKSLLQSSEHHTGHALSFSQDNDTS